MLYKYKQKKNHIDRYEKMKKKDARRQIGVKGVEKRGKKRTAQKGLYKYIRKKRENIKDEHCYMAKKDIRICPLATSQGKKQKDTSKL